MIGRSLRIPPAPPHFPPHTAWLFRRLLWLVTAVTTVTVVVATPALAATGGIDTIAGNGIVGFSGDDGPAIDASLSFPSPIAVDADGNLFVADRDNDRIRRVDAATGIISTVAGGGTRSHLIDGPATGAKLLSPHGIAVDADGNLLIADVGSGRIRRVDAATGIITNLAGGGFPGTLGDGGPATDASLQAPHSVISDADGNLFFVNDGRIRRVDGAGIITTVAGNGAFGFSGDGGPATNASLGAPNAIALDTNGDLFIADTANSRIRRVDAETGIITTVAGGATAEFAGDGGPATGASLFFPSGVTIDASGNLLIADTFNNRVRRVDAITGIITTVAGNGVFGFSGDGGPAANASLNVPRGIALDTNGDLFIADVGNSRIRRVDGIGAVALPVVPVPGVTGWGLAAIAGLLAFVFAIMQRRAFALKRLPESQRR